jgi:hypothetical protein
MELELIIESDRPVGEQSDHGRGERGKFTAEITNFDTFESDHRMVIDAVLLCLLAPES